VAYKYQMSIYVYSLAECGYHTDAFIYETKKDKKQNGQVHKLETMKLETPTPMKSVCIIHNGWNDGSGHFTYLKLHEV